ncbi:MAG: hypothetical protein WBG11_07645 [Methylocella sp.]
MPEVFKWWAEKSYFREPIAIFDNLLQNNENSIHAAWPQDLVLRVHDAFIRGYSLVQAWQNVSKPTIAGVLDTVRNRVL